MAGVAGVYGKNAALKAFHMLFNTQTRGQENCGMAAAGNHTVRKYCGKGLLSAVFDEDVRGAFFHPTDYVAIGHVGSKRVESENIAPVKAESDNYEIAVAMDGAISSGMGAERKVRFESNEAFYSAIFLDNLEKSCDIGTAVAKTARELGKGYYSVVIAVRDKEKERSTLTAYRNLRGIKPLYVKRTENELYVSSESGATDCITSDKVLEERDVTPGELLVRGKNGIADEQLFEPKRAHCVFEWVYTARPDAVMEGFNAHTVRKKLGHALAELHGLRDDGNSVVIGIPDSGRSVALGIHEASGIPFDEGLIKNQFVGRTYDMPKEAQRRFFADMKHNPIYEVVKGRRVYIGDDSIVRGTISDAVAKRLLNAGAKEVNLAISYAPIFEPCFSDEPDKKLAAKPYRGLDVFEIGRKVAEGLPSISNVLYNTVENVVKAVGLPEEWFCTYCITGKNPFEDMDAKNG
ncbi:MAG: hypothetical protein QXD77_02575 [Candidatus Aenigmatarchaeota archaeon]